MRVDLHVHTSRYSECGKSTPEEMLQRALEEGLDGLVLTEHNVIWPLEAFRVLQAQFPMLHLFRGVEMTVDSGDHYLVYGLTDPDALQQGMPSDLLVQRVHAAGGAVVLAHPFRYGPDLPPTLEAYPTDAIEIYSHNILAYAHEQAEALCRRLGVRPIAASDGHHVSTVGLYSVCLAHNHVADETSLARAIVAGEYRLTADVARVDALNAALPERVAAARALMDQGLTNDQIHERLGLGLTPIRGIRAGHDVSYPR